MVAMHVADECRDLVIPLYVDAGRPGIQFLHNLRVGEFSGPAFGDEGGRERVESFLPFRVINGSPAKDDAKCDKG